MESCGREWTSKTTVAFARLVFSGVLHRYPKLRLVASHGGGTIP